MKNLLLTLVLYFSFVVNVSAALTLNDFIGIETSGGEEFTTVAGSPVFTETTIVRSGTFSVKLDNTGTLVISPYDIIASGGDKHIVGFGIYLAALPGGDEGIIRAQTSGATRIWSIDIELDGDWVFGDTGLNTTTITNPMSTGAWHFVEIIWEDATDPATIDIHLDGASIMSLTDADILGSGAFDQYEFRDNGSSAIEYLDDFYFMSGATGTSDFLSNTDGVGPEVFMYQNTVEDATDQGDILDNGTWALIGEVPLNEGTSNDASYDVGAAAKIGHTITDSADSNARPGPSGDANVDGDSNIKGAKWIARLSRTTGGGVTHKFRHGDDAGQTDTTVTLSTAYATFFQLSESVNVPSSTQDFAIGFGSSDSGGQDPIAGDLWSMLLHVPSVVSFLRSRGTLLGVGQ